MKDTWLNLKFQFTKFVQGPGDLAHGDQRFTGNRPAEIKHIIILNIF